MGDNLTGKYFKLSEEAKNKSIRAPRINRSCFWIPSMSLQSESVGSINRPEEGLGPVGAFAEPGLCTRGRELETCNRGDSNVFSAKLIAIPFEGFWMFFGEHRFYSIPDNICIVGDQKFHMHDKN